MKTRPPQWRTSCSSPRRRCVERPATPSLGAQVQVAGRSENCSDIKEPTLEQTTPLSRAEACTSAVRLVRLGLYGVGKRRADPPSTERRATMTGGVRPVSVKSTESASQLPTQPVGLGAWAYSRAGRQDRQAAAPELAQSRPWRPLGCGVHLAVVWLCALRPGGTS